MNMEFERKLAIPTEVKRMYPITAKVSTIVEKRARKIADIFEGKEPAAVFCHGRNQRCNGVDIQECGDGKPGNQCGQSTGSFVVF